MFGDKQRQIADLERRLAYGEQQYNQAQTQINELRGLLDQAGGGDLLQIRDAGTRMQAQYTQVHDQMEQRRVAGEQQLRALDAALLERRQELTRLDQGVAGRQRALAEYDVHLADAAMLTDVGITNYPHPAQASLHLGAELQAVRQQIKAMVRNKRAIDANINFQFNGSAAKGRRFVDDMSKMMLRAYNAEAENCVLTVKAGNVGTARKRLDRASDQVARLGTMINLRINPHYHYLRQEELRLALDHQNAKKAQRDAEREERARLREEQRAQREFEEKRRDLTKQRDHYLNVLATLEAQGRDDEATEMRDRLEDLEEEIRSVDFRAANIRAGYVYVISNIGSFGDRMVKIGMTRRLEPMDRVRELGDASVPFGFDVHALFFSEDAVGVEAELHRRFAAQRVNRVNTRREFFYATPAQVRDTLTDIAGNLLEFTDKPEAEQYRLSLAAATNEHGGSPANQGAGTRPGLEWDGEPAQAKPDDEG